MTSVPVSVVKNGFVAVFLPCALPAILQFHAAEVLAVVLPAAQQPCVAVQRPCGALGVQLQFVFAVMPVGLVEVVAVDVGGGGVVAGIGVAEGVFGGECDAAEREGFGKVDACLVTGYGVGGAVDAGTVQCVVGGR